MLKMKLIIVVSLVVLFACKKKSGSTDAGSTGGGGNVDPTDPPVANTIGFFLNDWQPKNFTTPSYTDTSVPSSATGAYVTIDAADVITKIPKYIFGQNANIWMTQMVTEPILINHLTNLQPNVIRFPGG